MAVVLSAQRLTLVAGGRTLLENADLRIAAGEKCLIVGESGSGKSTLMRCWLGFTTPAFGVGSGAALVDGEAVTPRSSWAVRRKLGFVAQEPTLPPGTVRECFRAPFAFRANQDKQFDEPAAAALLETLDLPPTLLDRETADLSGGEKQRVALIAAILLGRGCYLLDEPTSALDAHHAAQVAEHFRTQPDQTVLAVTHDPEPFTGWDRVIRLPEGVG
ncbi:MAG: ATP-binding cassette domain-containing protein [Planctomycetota bacterium]